MFFKIGAYKNFVRNVHRKTSALPRFLNTVGGFQAILLKKTPKQVFSCEYCEIFKNTYFEEHL